MILDKIADLPNRKISTIKVHLQERLIERKRKVNVPLYLAQWLRRWVPNPGVPCSKPLGGSKVESAFHPSEVGKMSTRKFWELSGKK